MFILISSRVVHLTYRLWYIHSFQLMFYILQEGSFRSHSEHQIQFTCLIFRYGRKSLEKDMLNATECSYVNSMHTLPSRRFVTSWRKTCSRPRIPYPIEVFIHFTSLSNIRKISFRSHAFRVDFFVLSESLDIVTIKPHKKLIECQ